MQMTTVQTVIGNRQFRWCKAVVVMDELSQKNACQVLGKSSRLQRRSSEPWHPSSPYIVIVCNKHDHCDSSDKTSRGVTKLLRVTCFSHFRRNSCYVYGGRGARQGCAKLHAVGIRCIQAQQRAVGNSGSSSNDGLSTANDAGLCKIPTHKTNNMQRRARQPSQIWQYSHKVLVCDRCPLTKPTTCSGGQANLRVLGSSLAVLPSRCRMPVTAAATMSWPASPMSCTSGDPPVRSTQLP